MPVTCVSVMALILLQLKKRACVSTVKRQQLLSSTCVSYMASNLLQLEKCTCVSTSYKFNNYITSVHACHLLSVMALILLHLKKRTCVSTVTSQQLLPSTCVSGISSNLLQPRKCTCVSTKVKNLLLNSHFCKCHCLRPVSSFSLPSSLHS